MAKGVGDGPWTEAERRRFLSAEGGSCEGVTRSIGAIMGGEEEEDDAEPAGVAIGSVWWVGGGNFGVCWEFVEGLGGETPERE